MLDKTFLQARKTALETEITELETALSGLATGAIQQYSLNTGQTVEAVTKVNMGTINRVLEGKYALLQTVCNNLNPGSAGMVGRPCD